MGRIRIHGTTDERGELTSMTFTKGQGSFTLPVSDESEQGDTNEREQRKEGKRPRLLFAEWTEKVDRSER